MEWGEARRVGRALACRWGLATSLHVWGGCWLYSREERGFGLVVVHLCAAGRDGKINVEEGDALSSSVCQLMCGRTL